MKKFFVSLMLVGVLLVSGCTPVTEKGEYKEGTYFGSKAFESYGSNYVATAVVYVNEDGKIASVFIDSTYTKDGANTTKKVLGDDYGMKASAPSGKEWYEQINTLEDKVVSEQGLSWLEWTDDTKTKTDSVAGVTISVDAYYAAVEAALSQAK